MAPPPIVVTTCTYLIAAYYSFIDPERMKGLVCLVASIAAEKKQKAQLSQKGRAMPRVVEYFGLS